MDLFCPHCSRRVTIPDDQSGQVLNCPLCAKQFMAPTLAPPPMAPKPAPPPSAPSPPVESYSVGPSPVTPPSPAPMPISAPAPAAEPPPPPMPPGHSARSHSCQLTGDWLAYVPPVCVLLIFILSFFSWHNLDSTHTPSLWSLAFVEQKLDDAKLRDEVKQAHLLFYTILMIPAVILSFIALLFDKSWVPAPPQIAPFLPLKNLLVGLILGLAFLLLCFDALNAHLMMSRNPTLLPMKLAFRLHFLAMAASFLMFWIHWRKKSNLPPPTCDVRW